MVDRLSLSDGRNVSWHEFGDPHGKPLLCCHGNPDAGSIFAIFDAAAVEVGVRIVAPDRPGFGRSDSLESPYSETIGVSVHGSMASADATMSCSTP